MITNRDQLTPKQVEVLDIIESHNALVAIVFDVREEYGKAPVIDYSLIDEEYLRQIKDPNKNRPSRTDIFFKTKSPPEPTPKTVNKMHMRTEKLSTHTVFDNVAGNIYHHTKKTATSLMPTDPRFMELFQCDWGIGFLWCIKTCDLKKEKYVFFVNAGTNSGFWFDLDSQEKIDQLKERLAKEPLATIQKLREKNDNAVKNKKAISWNEILAGLPEKTLISVFATIDNRICRLRSLRAMLHAKEFLGFKEDLPLFINQPYYEQIEGEKIPEREAVFRFYNEDEQKSDLAAEKIENDNLERSLDILKKHKALAMIIPDEKSLEKLLTQIENPTLNRPSRSADFFATQGKPRPEVLTKMNLKTENLDTNFHPGESRKKKPIGYQYPDTVKLETFLLPREPQWMTVSDDDFTFGLFWNSDECDLKNGKYIFKGTPQVEKTNNCFWFDLDTPEKIATLQKRLASDPVVTLDTLRQQNDQAQQDKKFIPRNTILAGLPKGKVDGVFCWVTAYSDSYENRLKTYRLMLKIKSTLKLENDIPVFIVQSNFDRFRVYNNIELAWDLISEQWNSINPKKFHQKMLLSNKMLKARVRNEGEKEDDYVMVEHPSSPPRNASP